MSAPGTLKQLRGELIGVVTQLTTYDHVPGRVSLPAAILAAGSPYISAGQTFGARHVRFNLIILTAPSLNSIQTDELDLWIEDIQHDLESAGWVVEQVEQPRIEELGDTEVLSTTITVGCEADFTREENP